MELFGNSGSVALDVIVLAAMIVPLPVLGFICWIFWKAKQREDAERDARGRPFG
jgi:hypothetical protein